MTYILGISYNFFRQDM